MEGSLKKGALGVGGNLMLQDRLLQYLEGGRIHPAAILTGPAGETKIQLARNVAKHLLCPQAKSQPPFCNACSTCKRIDKDRHPDVVVWRQNEEDVIKIDTVRELCHQMVLTPVEGATKICIVDECHRLNVASANAFLKTLEEPGEGRYFWLLTSQVGSLLPTILSRCLKFRLRPEGPDTAPDAAAVENTKALEMLWGQVCQSGDCSTLVTGLDKKDKASAFIAFLQRDLRTQILKEPESDQSFQLLERFEQAVHVEGRLRSNANYGLMLESFLTQYFFNTP